MFNILLSANAEKPPVYTILFAGNNFQRLFVGTLCYPSSQLDCGFAFPSLRYSFRAFHEKKGSHKSGSQPALSGLYPDYAAAGFAVLVYFGTARIAGFHLSGEASGNSGLYPLGYGGNGRPGSSSHRQHSQAPEGKRQESWFKFLADLPLYHYSPNGKTPDSFKH